MSEDMHKYKWSLQAKVQGQLNARGNFHADDVCLSSTCKLHALLH